VRIGEIRAIPAEQLRKDLGSYYEELLRLRFRWATRQLDNVNEIRKVKKKIARIKTVLKEWQP